MPTLIICGTPGVGKSSIVERLKSKLPDANYINLSQFAIENKCTSGFDEKLASHIIDDDKLIEMLEPELGCAKQQLNIIESVHADHLDADKVDRVVVIRADTAKLYDRLQARGYQEQKISNNVEAEIFQMIRDEAVEYFGSDLVTELENNVPSDLDANVSAIHKLVCDLLN